jgi:ferredoxin
MEKTLKLIPITPNDHKIQGNNLILSSAADRKKVKVIVEKAINCVGCGACLPLCKNNALSIEKGSLTVNANKCNKCGECLRASKLRGACLRRNYAPIRYQVRSNITENNNEDIVEERLSNLCSGSEIVGQIRSRVPIQQTMKRILTLDKATKLGEAILVRNQVFTAIFKQNKSFTEVRFRTDEDSFAATVEVIRDVLKKTPCITQ